MATTLNEVPELLGKLQGEAEILAGGTDLLPGIKRGLCKPMTLLSLNRIPGLLDLSCYPGEGLHIGALVSHARVAGHPGVKEKYTALADACAAVGSPQIRNLGTVVGNIANASPAADTAPALLSLNAQVVIRGPDGTHSVPLADFFLGPGRTVLSHGEIIQGIYVPEPPPGTRSVYLKLGRRKALEISICSVALAATPSGRWRHVRLALGAVAPVPLLDAEAAARMEEQVWTPDLMREAGHSASSHASPIDDQRASAAYRRSMIEILVRRSMESLNSLAGGATGPDA
jgi:carbon-monoxide dehydrogenase medium subunit